MSHPSWVRGLKHRQNKSAHSEEQVAPFMGAWIETYRYRAFPAKLQVAPFMGALIETYFWRP